MTIFKLITLTRNQSDSIYCCKSHLVMFILDLYPKMTQFPQLLKPETVNTNVRFPCKVIYPTGDPTVAFNVMWNVDGNTLLDPATSKPVANTLTGDQRVAYLDSKYLMGHLGKNVSEKRYEFKKLIFIHVILQLSKIKHEVTKVKDIALYDYISKVVRS